MNSPNNDVMSSRGSMIPTILHINQAAIDILPADLAANSSSNGDVVKRPRFLNEVLWPKPNSYTRFKTMRETLVVMYIYIRSRASMHIKWSAVSSWVDVLMMRGRGWVGRSVSTGR